MREEPSEVDVPGFPEAEVDGFVLGQMVHADPAGHGEAFVEAPDGSMATVFWETGEPESVEKLLAPPAEGWWGHWGARLLLPMTDDAEAATWLRALLPRLQPEWQAWRDSKG